jgi:multidrug resistance efflux pump
MFLPRYKRVSAVLAVAWLLSVWGLSQSTGAAPSQKSDPAEKEAPKQRDWVEVPARVSGVIVSLGLEAGEGKKDRPLREGDQVQAGTVLGKIDDALARAEVAIREAKVQAAIAEAESAIRTRDEAKIRYELRKKLSERDGGIKEEVTAARLTWERYVEEVKAREAGVEVARRELQKSKIELDMHTLRSPVRGVIQEIHRQRGEAVRQYEPVVRIRIVE